MYSISRIVILSITTPPSTRKQSKSLVAALGLICVARNPSPTTETFSGTSNGNVSVNVPALIRIVSPEFACDSACLIVAYASLGRLPLLVSLPFTVT